MKFTNFNILFKTIVITTAFSCCTTNQKQTQPQKAEADSAVTPLVKSEQTLPAIKPNTTFIGARINNIEIIDEFRYRLTVTIATAIPLEDMESLIELDQTLVVEPEFVLTEDGKVDPSNPRNEKLLNLRSMQVGDNFIGKVSLNSAGKWVLFDVE